jgi:hypothetical protein
MPAVIIAGHPHRSTAAALDAARDGESVIRLDGMHLVLDRASADSLAETGVEFSIVFTVPFGGDGETRIVMAPVGD